MVRGRGGEVVVPREEVRESLSGVRERVEERTRVGRRRRGSNRMMLVGVGGWGELGGGCCCWLLESTCSCCCGFFFGEGRDFAIWVFFLLTSVFL